MKAWTSVPFCALVAVSSVARAEVPLHVDVSTGVLFRRSPDTGTAALFGGDRVGLALRGAVWFNHAHARLGAWLGYRYEPGETTGMFGGRVRSWQVAHDLDLGLVGQYTFGSSPVEKPANYALFVRSHAGFGLTFSTLQLQSLDDGNLYSHASVGLNGTLSASVGLRFWGVLEAFVEGGYLSSGIEQLELKQDEVEFGSSQRVKIAVPRDGLFTYGGVGLEF